MHVEYYNTSLVESDVDLHYCGYEDTTPNFNCGPNVRDCYLFHYVSRGEGYYTTGGKTYNLREGAIFCIFPKEIVYYYANSENPWSFYWFSFSGRKALDYVSQIGFSISSPVMWLSPETQLPLLMNKLLHAYGTGKEIPRISLLSHLYALLAELEAQHKATGSRSIPPKSSALYIEKALQYISYNYHREIRIAEIANYLGLDRTYFSKLFAQIIGVPPQTYLLRFRIEKTLPLLQQSELSISDISRSVGIDDTYYFSRVFKQVMGEAPTRYRQIKCRYKRLVRPK